MQVNETSAEGLKREYKIVVPANDIEDKLVGRLNEIGQSVSVPGFRPGKAPIGLLRKRYGDSLRGEILEQTIQDSLWKAMDEQGVRPASQPQIEVVTFEEGVDLEYKLAIELLPEIKLPDFSKLKMERLVAEVDEKEVDSSLENLAKQRQNFAAADEGHAAENGDQTKIDFVGRIDGEEFEGGAAQDFELELGSGRFIPGFEEQIVGAKVGDEREVEVSFPDEYPAEHLKGKAAVFSVTIKEVKTPQAVEIDDEFAKSVGAESLEDVKKSVREMFEREYGQASRARLKRTLLDELAKNEEFELPPGMIEREFENIWAQVKEAKEKDQLDEDDKGKNDEELEASYRDIAARRVRLGLLLTEVGRTNNISVGQEEINRAMSEQARMFPGKEQELFDYYAKNPEAQQSLQAPILEDKVVDYILELAQLKDRAVSPEELMSEPESAGKD